MSLKIDANFTNRLKTGAVLKLAIWLALSILITLVFGREFWAKLPLLFSPGYIANFHTAQWGVLVLCLAFLFFKRKELDLKAGNGVKTITWRVIAAVFLIVAAYWIPPLQDYLLLKVLLVALGVFAGIFGRAARLPAILLGVFAFSIIFPLAMKLFFEASYVRGVLIPLMAIMKALGYPLQNQGQLVSFTSAGGEAISVNVSLECAGPVTMAVFISLFSLMMLDAPRPPARAAGLFLLGLAGTWLQSLIRLVVLMLAGYHLGSAALWTAHYWTVYVLFPLWYLIFAWIYFRTSNRTAAAGLTPGGENAVVADGR